MPASSAEEMYYLVDQFYDGKIDPAGIARIEALILENPRNLQSYVERFDFHCELREQADYRPAELTALEMLHRSALSLAHREHRQQWHMGLLLAVCIFILLAGLGWMYDSAVSRIPVGTIASLSADLKTASAPLQLGQVLRQRETISILEGIVSVQLPEVIIDLIGPATLRFERQGRVFLSRGTVVAKVEPGGIGFIVKTSETEVIDLGTEFLVRCDQQTGTYVSVRRGAAQTRQLDRSGTPVKIVDVTASRALQFPSGGAEKEVAYSAEDFLPVDRSRGGIHRLTGALRTISDVPVSLASDQLTTPNHMLVIPEREITLDSDLTVNSLSGPVTIPAGTTVGSYLVHYDPTLIIHSAPRGAITFSSEIAAIIGSSVELNATDPLFGLSQMQYESQPFRELELDEDEAQVSDDRKTVSFFFGITPPELLDEARILVVLGPH